MVSFISFIYHKGKEQGCVAMGTGMNAGLWDVISCQETANFLCKQWAAGVPPPAPPAQVPAAACAEGWDGASQGHSCYKVSVRLLPCKAEHGGVQGSVPCLSWCAGTQCWDIFGELSSPWKRKTNPWDIAIKNNKTQQQKACYNENRELKMCFLLFK